MKFSVCDVPRHICINDKGEVQSVIDNKPFLFDTFVEAEMAIRNHRLLMRRRRRAARKLTIATEGMYIA